MRSAENAVLVTREKFHVMVGKCWQDRTGFDNSVAALSWVRGKGWRIQMLDSGTTMFRAQGGHGGGIPGQGQIEIMYTCAVIHASHQSTQTSMHHCNQTSTPMVSGVWESQDWNHKWTRSSLDIQASPLHVVTSWLREFLASIELQSA